MISVGHPGRCRRGTVKLSPKGQKNDREKAQKIKRRIMKIIKEQFDFTDEEIMRIACEDWAHIMDGGVLAVWGKDILNLDNREE